MSKVRKPRTIYVMDDAWAKLGRAAKKLRLGRGQYVEALVDLYDVQVVARRKR